MRHIFRVVFYIRVDDSESRFDYYVHTVILNQWFDIRT